MTISRRGVPARLRCLDDALQLIGNPPGQPHAGSLSASSSKDAARRMRIGCGTFLGLEFVLLPFITQWEVVLADLVVLGQVRVIVALAVLHLECSPAIVLQWCARPTLIGVFDRLFVHDRQPRRAARAPVRSTWVLGLPPNPSWRALDKHLGLGGELDRGSPSRPAPGRIYRREKWSRCTPCGRAI